MKIYCLGTMDCFPVKGNDSSSYLIDGHILIDTSYATVNNLLNGGYDPLNIDTIIITHWHFDHYAGLAELLYYIYFHKCENLKSRLTIICPSESATETVAAAIEYFRLSDSKLSICKREAIGFPNMIELDKCGEINHKGYKIRYVSSSHPVDGRCYRITDSQGKCIGLSGDTAYKDDIIPLFSNVDLLLFEASYGIKDIAPDNPNGHCSAHDAGRIAQKSNAKKLAIVHSRHEREKLSECASEYYNGEIVCPISGNELFV